MASRGTSPRSRTARARRRRSDGAATAAERSSRPSSSRPRHIARRRSRRGGRRRRQHSPPIETKHGCAGHARARGGRARSPGSCRRAARSWDTSSAPQSPSIRARGRRLVRPPVHHAHGRTCGPAPATRRNGPAAASAATCPCSLRSPPAPRRPSLPFASPACTLLRTRQRQARRRPITPRSAIVRFATGRRSTLRCPPFRRSP